MPVTDDRLRELARTHLGDYGYADAMNALVDTADCTELPVIVHRRASRPTASVGH